MTLESIVEELKLQGIRPRAAGRAVKIVRHARTVRVCVYDLDNEGRAFVVAETRGMPLTVSDEQRIATLLGISHRPTLRAGEIPLSRHARRFRRWAPNIAHQLGI